MLEVTYASAHFERVCTDERAMRKEVGAEVAKALRRRLAELRSAETMADVLDGPGRWEQLTGDRRGTWSARVSANWRLIVEVAGADSTSVVVVRLEDYH
ncbi:type II toxin-antitoxin system RelE/ParE family toxin [Cellulosimicrobium sp. CpK407]|uniref:type II toxin-antitoxin system RelE/ParE family toxin n=1 Tax=Cellulosimicrobium sp. CpK407 TaxID=3229847 RepID=UPI003F3FEEB3